MMTTASPEWAGAALQNALDDWWRQEGCRGPLCLRPIERWLRPYSELVVFEVGSSDGGERRKLVSKRVIHHTCNAIYGGPAELLRSEYNALEEAREYFDTRHNYSVPRPRLLLPDLDLLIMDFVPGESLEPSLAALKFTARRDSWRTLVRQFWKLGRWLHYYQQSGPRESAGIEALDSVIQHCDHRLQIVEATRHRWLPAQFRSRVLRRIEAWTKRLTEPVLRTRCHGDFGPWNALVHGLELTILDFSVARQDCAAIDPLGVLVYLEAQRHAPSFSGRRVRQLQQIFLRGYACAEVVPIPVIAVCEALQRICRLQDCLCSANSENVVLSARNQATAADCRLQVAALPHCDESRSIGDRYRNRQVFRENLRQLLTQELPRYTDWTQVRTT